MKKVIFDIPYTITGTQDTLDALYDFCDERRIGRIYSRFREMNQNQREGKRLISLLDSLGFTGKSNSLSVPSSYEARQWFGYSEDWPAIQELLDFIGEVE